MVNKITIILAILSTYFSFGQTNEETVSYINNILSLKTSNILSYSLEQYDENYYTVSSKLYNPNNKTQILYFKFNPADAIYINTSTDSEGRTSVIFSYKKNSVKLLFEKEGDVVEELSQIKIAPLININKTDLEKFIKAYKHFIKLNGGAVKDEPFQ